MAQEENLDARHMESYVDTGNEKSIEITLSGTPETVTTVSIPSYAKGFRVYSATLGLRFAVNATVTAIGTSSDTTIASSVFTTGGVIVPANWETRLLPPQIRIKSTDVERTISFSCTVASAVFKLEIF
jgi:hypothetical protein